VASLEKSRNKRGGYVVRYRGPDRKQRSQTFRKRADADRFFRTVEADVIRGTWVDPTAGRILLSEWADRCANTTVDLRPTTRARDDATYRNHVKPAFGDLPLSVIDHLAVTEWIAELNAKGLAPATVQKAHQVLSKIMRAAVDSGKLNGSPCERIKLPKIEREEMRFLGPDEIATLAGAIDKRYRALVLLGAYGGLRAGEMFGLRRGRVDLLRGNVDVAEIAVEVRGHFFYGPPKTRAGRRTVPLPRSVVDVLTTHCAELVEPGALVFPAPQGGTIRASMFRRRIWTPACIAAGLGQLTKVEGKEHYEGLRLHDLRHSAVALWITAGASAKEIATRAGHTSVSVVLDRYGHLLPGTEERVTDALDVLARTAADGVCDKRATVVEMRPTGRVPAADIGR
jgi:integrase